MSGEAGAAAPAAPAAAAAPPAAETKAPVAAAADVEPSEEYEIDGKRVSLTRTQARTMLQKAGAVDKRMQETAEERKKLDALTKLMETDPEEFIRKSGKDPEKILAAYLARKAKLELMSPEQQAAVKLQEERDALKAQLAKLEAQQKEDAQKQLDQRNEAALQEQLIAAGDKYGLDKTPEVLEGLCEVALDLLEVGIAAPTADQVAQEYLRREQEHLETRDKKLLSKLKGERLKAYLKANIPALLSLPSADLLELLGPAGVKAIQSATLTKVPAAAKKPLTPPAPAPPARVPPRNGAGKFVTEADFDRKFRR